ncbi:unnamed protein product [Ciceribacter sp. T2.26MG-112.2]|nr:unnamed protein product [Ciceribacter naphthalenivorans]
MLRIYDVASKNAGVLGDPAEATMFYATQPDMPKEALNWRGAE